PVRGVMMPQPLVELRGRADEVRHHALGVIVAGVIAAALVSWLVSGYMSRRLQGVSEAARAMADGGRDMRVQRPAGLDPRELSELSEAFNAMAEQVERSSH
ncbi:MAG: HAMP domain-containing protein, partial [Pseudomonadota bacterium]|nr:HAMP domain-containing protein [Pseudomonadota bacterium]